MHLHPLIAWRKIDKDGVFGPFFFGGGWSSAAFTAQYFLTEWMEAAPKAPERLISTRNLNIIR